MKNINVFSGPMKCGKSQKILDEANRQKIAGKNFKGANMVVESSIKNLMDSIAIATGDKFVQSLPKVEKEAYAIFNIEPNAKSFLNIKDKFVIYHDM